MKRARTENAKEDRRRQLLAAALDELFEKGFAATRMEDIASRAGFSKGTLYLYFDSKEALFEALIESVALPNLARIEQTVSEIADPREAIRALMSFASGMVLHSDLPRIVKILIADSGSFPEVVQGYRRNVLERLLGGVELLLSKASEDGALAVEHAALSARLLLAPVVFSALWTTVFESLEERSGGRGLDVETLLALHAEQQLKAFAPEGSR